MPWKDTRRISGIRYICGYCGRHVAPGEGYIFVSQETWPFPSDQESTSPDTWRVLICPFCDRPTFKAGDLQSPGLVFGGVVAGLPDPVRQLYDEARACMAVGSFTAAVLACRKLLMYIAVTQGAGKGKSFLACIEYLAHKGYAPPDSTAWVDYVKAKSNEASHEIVPMTKRDAETLIAFSEMLLKLIFEFAARIP